MASDDKAQLAARHLLSSGIKTRMAKADLELPRKTGKGDAWRLVGPAIERCRELSRLSLKEFSDAIERDEKQVRSWIKGEERPQLDVIFAVPRFRGPLVIALAELARDIEVITTIAVRQEIA